MKVNLYGSIWGCSGYANHTKHLVNALCDIGVDVSLQSQVPQGWERVVNDNELKMITKPIHMDGIDLMIDLPTNWKMVSSERQPFIGFLVWEGDKIPEYWIDYLLDDAVTQIWVPSQHTKKAIENTIANMKNDEFPILSTNEINILNKIKIVPHGVDKEIFKPEEPKKEKEVFTFIATKGWRHNLDRGGLQYLIKAYSEEFTSKDKVEMLIKLNTAYGIPDIQQLLTELDIKNVDKPKLSFITQEMTLKDLNNFYNYGDVFVSTTMAEAFNLGGIEAMACGKPTLQTNFGGQTDYMTRDNSFKIEQGEMIPVTWETMYEEVCWFKPDIDDIKKQLRYCFENKDIVKAKGKNAKLTTDKWTWIESAKKAKVCLEEINNDK